MITCASPQRPLARRLHEHLVRRGCTPKLDSLDIPTGERWRQTVAWWLSACQAAVVLVSREAVDSPWLRYELSVLSNREALGDVRLVLVYVGLSPKEGVLQPFGEMADVQSSFLLADDEPDDEVLVELADVVAAASDAPSAPPVERLVRRVEREVGDVAVDRVAAARADLEGPVPDPWLTGQPDVRRDFSEAYCATPLVRTYPSLQTLAQDRHLDIRDLHQLVDFNVMTAFDARALGDLREAAERRGGSSLVSSITRADLAEVAVDAAHLESTMSSYPFRFVVHGPITGSTEADVADGLAAELREAIGEAADDGEDPDEFLAAVAHRRHPVFVLLAGAAGITGNVLRSLERRFPTVVFVVLSSPRRTMLALAAELGIDGTGVAVDDQLIWAAHVHHERDLAGERIALRTDLHRLKRALQR